MRPAASGRARAEANYGWSAVNMVVFPPVVLGLAVLAVASFAKRRAASQQVPEFPDPRI
jgi:hypothetical protein